MPHSANPEPWVDMIPAAAGAGRGSAASMVRCHEQAVDPGGPGVAEPGECQPTAGIHAHTRDRRGEVSGPRRSRVTGQSVAGRAFSRWSRTLDALSGQETASPAQSLKGEYQSLRVNPFGVLRKVIKTSNVWKLEYRHGPPGGVASSGSLARRGSCTGPPGKRGLSGLRASGPEAGSFTSHWRMPL
jgi:hypothetical protein